MNENEEFQIEDQAKKLTLWHTRTFRPILTHDELDPLMSLLGFVPLPMSMTSCGGGGGGGLAWREYVFRSERRGGGGRGGFSPRPRLPFPRIDGLHLLAYRAFFEALEFYLGAHLVPEIFHVRSMTIRADDKFLAFYRPMRDCDMDEEGVFVYRDGTLDHITKMVCNSNSINNAMASKYGSNRESSNNLICMVPLDDLFPRQDIRGLV